MLDMLMNPGVALLLVLIAVGLILVVKGQRWRDEYRQFQAWRTAGMPSALAQEAVIPTSGATPWDGDLTILPDAGSALQNPPTDLRVALTYMQQNYPKATYQVPLGWHRANGTADLVVASLVGDVNHILITGQSDSGKDNLALNMLFALTVRYRPDQMQCAIIDGKGLDWVGWEEKAHTWHVAIEPEQIADSMQRLVAERQRRYSILREARVAKWDEYTGNDLPLLVVYVSELLLLQNATSKSELTNWLNAELTSARAAGIRYVIACQTASNFDTQWRSQISLFLAGFQPSQSQDQPNTNLSTRELEELGAIPPSKLPNPPKGAGVFTAVQGRNTFTVRSSYLPSQHRQWLLDQLPNRQKFLHTTSKNAVLETPMNPNHVADQDMLLHLLHTNQPLPMSDTPVGRVGHPTTAVEPLYREARDQFVGPVGRSTATTDLSVSGTIATSDVGGSTRPVLPPEEVPIEEQARILAAVPTVKSKRQLAMQLYNVDGGQKYAWVRKVCEAAGVAL